MMMVLGESCTLIIVQWWPHNDDTATMMTRQTDRQIITELWRSYQINGWCRWWLSALLLSIFSTKNFSYLNLFWHHVVWTMLLWQHHDDGWRQVTLHVALVHSFVNPSLFIVLHRGIRQVDQIDFYQTQIRSLPCLVSQSLGHFLLLLRLEGCEPGVWRFMPPLLDLFHRLLPHQLLKFGPNFESKFLPKFCTKIKM